MVKEDILWQQRSRVEWLKSGDFNTSYFHSRATQRNRRNFISKLVLDDGSPVERDYKNGEAMVDYFRNIFTSAASSNFNQILQGIETRFPPQMSLALTREYTTIEVEHALKQMMHLSAPGLNGMSPTFYLFGT